MKPELVNGATKLSRIRLLILCLAFPVFAGGLLAWEDELFEGKGESIWPIDNDQVEMIQQEVSITAAINPLSSFDEYRVDSTFVLRNTGGDTSIQVGFTDYPGYSDALEHFATIRGFQCWINGEPVKVEPRSGPAHPVETWMHPDNVYVMEVAFKQGETKTIRNAYLFGGKYSGYDDRKTISYVLKTGALWKGPIKNTKITINGIDTRFTESIQPEGYVFDDKSIRWEMHAAAPVSDIAVRYYVSSTRIAKTADTFFANDTHSDNEVKEFLQKISYELQVAMYNKTEGKKAMQEYLYKILDLAPRTYFNTTQLITMYDIIGRTETAAKQTAAYLDRVAKQEVPYDENIILQIADFWEPSNVDFDIAVRARRIHADHEKAASRYPLMIAWEYQNTGDLAKRRKDYAAAVEHYKEALEEARTKGSDHQDIEQHCLFEAADCHLRLRNYVEAKSCLLLLIDKYPNGEFTEAARKQLAVLENMKKSSSR